MVEAIAQWISSGKDYNSGLSLYYMYGKNPRLNRIFSTGGADRATSGISVTTFDDDQLVADNQLYPEIGDVTTYQKKFSEFSIIIT